MNHSKRLRFLATLVHVILETALDVVVIIMSARIVVHNKLAVLNDGVIDAHVVNTFTY